MQPEASRAGFRSQSPLPTQSKCELTVRNNIGKPRIFNEFELGSETPIAPGRGENWPFGERFRRSFHSRSPECVG